MPLLTTGWPSTISHVCLWVSMCSFRLETPSRQYVRSPEGTILLLGLPWLVPLRRQIPPPKARSSFQVLPRPASDCLHETHGSLDCAARLRSASLRIRVNEVPLLQFLLRRSTQQLSSVGVDTQHSLLERNTLQRTADLSPKLASVASRTSPCSLVLIVFTQGRRSERRLLASCRRGTATTAYDTGVIPRIPSFFCRVGFFFDFPLVRVLLLHGHGFGPLGVLRPSPVLR